MTAQTFRTFLKNYDPSNPTQTYLDLIKISHHLTPEQVNTLPVLGSIIDESIKAAPSFEVCRPTNLYNISHDTLQKLYEESSSFNSHLKISDFVYAHENMMLTLDSDHSKNVPFQKFSHALVEKNLSQLKALTRLKINDDIYEEIQSDLHESGLMSNEQNLKLLVSFFNNSYNLDESIGNNNYPFLAKSQFFDLVDKGIALSALFKTAPYYENLLGETSVFFKELEKTLPKPKNEYDVNVELFKSFQKEMESIITKHNNIYLEENHQDADISKPKTPKMR